LSERKGFVARFKASRIDSIGLAGEAKSFTAWGIGIASKATCLAAVASRLLAALPSSVQVRTRIRFARPGVHGHPQDPPGLARTGITPDKCSESVSRSLARDARSAPPRGRPRAPLRSSSPYRDGALYVENELRAYLDCGVFARGFTRCHRDACGHDLLVAFSCKSRTVCGRRPNATRAPSFSSWP
jgi:hypothetical protein